MTAQGAGSSSTSDYEQYTHDANGNVVTRRTRAGETLSFAYDALGRLTSKIVPERPGLSSTHTRDVYYGYDLRGRPSYARFDSPAGEGLAYVHDALGRMTNETLTMDGVSRTLTSGYDATGTRTSLTYPDNNYVNYYRDVVSQLYYSALNAGNPLFYPPYNADGSRAVMYRWNPGTASWNTSGGYTAFGYDALGRNNAITHGLGGSSYDSVTNFSFNPASQIIGSTRSNDAYAWTGAANADRPYTANGLNQYSAVAGIAFAHDANGNLTSDGANAYVYDAENRLVGRSGGAAASLRYDPLGRLYEVSGSSGTTRFLHDGSDLVAEYDAAGNLLRRYVHGTGGGDDPMVWFEGSGVADSARRYLFADERGSVAAVTDAGGNALTVNAYDEYGIPKAGNIGRFQYTGQAWLPELGMYYYKARMYSPTLGRFMQTDPIGYADGMNIYAYVGGDPVNGVDPTGLEIVVTGSRCRGVWIGDICVDTALLENMLRQVNYGEAGGSPGGGGGGGKRPAPPPPPPPPPQNDEESPICRDLHQAAENARQNVPGRVSDAWNDPAALRFFQLTYEKNRRDGGVLGALGAAVVFANRWNPFAPTKGAVEAGGRAGGLGGGAIYLHYDAYVDNIQVRLNQLERIADGSCRAPGG